MPHHVGDKKLIKEKKKNYEHNNGKKNPNKECLYHWNQWRNPGSEWSLHITKSLIYIYFLWLNMKRQYTRKLPFQINYIIVYQHELGLHT